MKKIFKLYRRWRYRRLYYKLFLLYNSKGYDAIKAIDNACYVFEVFTGEPYVEWLAREYFCVNLHSELSHEENAVDA